MDWIKLTSRSHFSTIRVSAEFQTSLPVVFPGNVASPVYAGIDTEMYKRATEQEIEELRQKHPGFPLLFHPAASDKALR